MYLKRAVISILFIITASIGFSQVVRPTSTAIVETYQHGRYLVIYNRTGAPLLEIYMTASPERGWGPDMLGNDVLLSDDSVYIEMPFLALGVPYYFKAVDNNYRFHYIKDVLPDISPKVVFLAENDITADTIVLPEKTATPWPVKTATPAPAADTKPPVDDISPFDPDILDPDDYYSADIIADEKIPDNAYALGLRNSTGETILEVYAASISNQNWGKNLISDTPIRDMGVYRVFIPKGEQSYFDFKFLGESGKFYFKWGVPMNDVSDLEIAPADHPL